MKVRPEPKEHDCVPHQRNQSQRCSQPTARQNTSSRNRHLVATSLRHLHAPEKSETVSQFFVFPRKHAKPHLRENTKLPNEPISVSHLPLLHQPLTTPSPSATAKNEPIFPPTFSLELGIWDLELPLSLPHSAFRVPRFLNRSMNPTIHKSSCDGPVKPNQRGGLFPTGKNLPHPPIQKSMNPVRAAPFQSIPTHSRGIPSPQRFLYCADSAGLWGEDATCRIREKRHQVARTPKMPRRRHQSVHPSIQSSTNPTIHSLGRAKSRRVHPFLGRIMNFL